MRIVCISASRVPSDTANSIQVMKVCQAFRQLGHETILLVPGRQPGDVPAQALMEHYGLKTHFEIEWLPVRNRRVFPWKAMRQAQREKADLIYSWPLQSAALALLRGFPSVLEMHDLPSGSFGPMWFRLFLTLPGNKVLAPITRALKARLEEKYPKLPEGSVVIAPDGVDAERYAGLPAPSVARQELGLPASPTVMCSGHLYDGRGAGLFLALAKRFPQASFVWVGGRPADVEEWKNRAKAHGLANAAFTGFVPNEQIPLYQSAADILMMPYQETVTTSSGGNTASICSPMKMFEYMAARRAIVTSDLAVLREVLDESMAVFCSPNSEGAWATALDTLLADENHRQSLGRCAYNTVGQYSWTERAKKILARLESENQS